MWEFSYITRDKAKGKTGSYSTKKEAADYRKKLIDLGLDCSELKELGKSPKKTKKKKKG